MVSGDRGQAYTLEGVLAAILVVTATVYGLQTIDTRAWEDETESETAQLTARANDVLTLAGESGSLRDSVMCYREGSSIRGSQEGSLTEFERILNTTFDRQANQYNLYFSYWDGSESREILVSQTETESSPPTTAASASTTVTIADNTSLRLPSNGCEEIPLTVKDTEGSFYMPDAAEDSPLFNIVEVRLVVW